MNNVIYDHSTETMILFKEFDSLGEAQVVQSLLESAGIWSMINNEYMSAFYPLAINAQIVIRKADLQRAKALVENY